jgi:ABC-type molybdate transport system substrate-binding protein
MPLSQPRRRALSLVILAMSVLIAAAPWTPFRRRLLVAIGSELEQPMRELETRFEREHPAVDLHWQVRGSQDMVNQALVPSGERPRVLIPASEELLRGLAERMRRQQNDSGLQDPQPVARTVLVAVSWPERAQALFGGDSFNWESLQQALSDGSWEQLGGQASWGRFNLRATDPARSNSGQLALLLWRRSQASDRAVMTWRRALYQPPRSTDILLREFIAAGPNDGDLAFVYESVALNRREESRQRQGEAYVLLVPDPSYETVLAASVIEGPASGRLGDGEALVRFLRRGPQQEVLMNWGFRSIDGRLPRGALTTTILPAPDQTQREGMLRIWQAAS